jgi:hypothetical protein
MYNVMYVAEGYDVVANELILSSITPQHYFQRQQEGTRYKMMMVRMRKYSWCVVF